MDAGVYYDGEVPATDGPEYAQPMDDQLLPNAGVCCFFFCF
jgi:hypothetical protein